MEPEIKRAFLRASAKLGIGLSLVAAVIGIRIVTATSPGIESGIEELERLDARLAAESTTASSEPLEAGAARDGVAGSDGEASVGSRMSATLRERLPTSQAETAQGDKLVSCDLRGKTHFMRADDCATRGGRSTVLPEEPELR
jgi:hypothetical protein